MTFEFKTILKKKYTFDNKMESSLQKTSKPKPGSLADTQESSITQILSQRLSNMEQQLKLLREDLKDAVETLKRKDQEITTLENKVALAERRRDAEKNGEPPAEDLRDLSEGVDPKLKSKQDLLQKECDTLSKKLQEMEKFFGDYGLAWVKEDAINETDQNNLWVRKTNIHYTPDFDKIFLVVEELNVGNAEPQIVRTENTAQFKTADLLHLTLYSDGIQLENNPFRQYDSPSVEEFFHDLEDGYFPSELRGEHPEGVIFKVKDMRSTRFADDPQKRPVVKRDRSLTSSPQRASTSSTSPAKSPTGKDRKGEQKSPSVNSGVRIGRRSKTLSLKSGTSIRKKIVKNVAAESTEAQKIADGIVTPTAAGGDIGPNGDIKPAASPVDETKKTSHDGKGVTGGEISPGKDDKSPKAVPGSDGPEGVATPAHGDLTAGAQGTEMNKGVDDGATPAPGGQGTEISGGVADGTTISASKGPSNNIGSENQVSVPQSTVNGLKQIFVAEKSPQGSSTRMSEPNAVTNEQKTDLEQERTLDSFGLPRPPLSPDGSSQVNKTKGPPLKHFENFFINKVGETQTSGTYIAQPPQNQPQSPTGNITNITYNEAPITIQMTPSELMGGERKTVPAPSKICCPIRTKPCDCANNAPPAVTIGDNDGIGTIEVIKPIGETEYREKYSEGAANWVNVLKQKHKYKEQEAKRLEELGKKVEAPLPPDPTWDSRAIDPNLDTRPPDRFWDPKAPDPRWDPNVKWSNFDYFGHQKGQAASPPPPTPVSPATASKKQSDTPQIIQLNEKTSERMISVKMRTRSGHKEFNANVYPEEPINKLWSLLKLNDKEYSLASSRSPDKQLKRGSIGEHSENNDVSLIISKTSDPPMAKKTGSATSTDYQPSKRTGSKSSTKDQSIKMKSGEKISTSGGMNETSKSSKTRDRQSSHESASYGSANLSGSSKVKANVSQDGFNASNVNVSKSSGSRTSRNENAEDKKFDKEGKYNPPKPKEPNIPITPKTRAKSLSEHLSQSSLRTKKSFMSISYRNSPIKGSVHLEPNMLEEKEKASVDSGNSEHPSTRSSKNPVKASSFPSVDNRKASSNTSMRGRISVSKLSLEKKGRRGSSRSFRIENRGDTSSGGNTSTKSPSQIPSAAAATMMDKGRSPKSPSQPPQAVDGAGPQDIERAVAGTYPSSPSQTPSAAATTVPQDKSKSPGSPSQPLMPAAGIKIEMHPPSPPNEKFHSPESVIRVDSSNITTRGRISVSKLSLEKEDRRRSSRSFKIENRGDTSSGGNTSTKSPSQIPSTAAATMPQDKGRSPRSPSQPPMTVPGTEPQDLETTVASTYPSSPSQTPSAAATTVPHDKSKSPGSPSQPPMPAGGIQIVIHPPSPPNEKFHLPESINRKVSSNISMRGRISVSKLSLEREGRRRSSRLFRIENRGDMSFGGNTSPKSPSQIPSAAAATMPQDKGRSPGSPSQPSKAIDVTAPQGIERASTSPGSTSQEPSAPPPSMPQDMGGFPKSRSQPPVTVPRTEPQDLETTVASTFPSPPSQTPSAAATTMPQEKDKSPGSTAQPPMDVPGTASQDLESTVARQSPRSPSQKPSAAATTKPQEKDKSPGSTAQLPMDVPGTASQDLESTVARQSPRSPSQKPSAAETTVPQDNEKSPRSPSQPPMTAAGIKIEIHSPSPPTDRPKDEVVTPIAAGDRPDEMEGTIHTLPKMDQRGSTNLQTSGNTGNFDDDLNGAVRKVGKERIVSPQNQDENVVKSEIKVPNAEPPQIKQSDADLMDEKESIGVSSVIHETKYEYDKHDSEQEFKRASLTNPNKIPVEVEKVLDGKLSPEPMEKKEDGNSSKKKKTGSKIKKRKSLENDGKGKHKNSQDLVTSNGSGEEKLGSTSPVISKEDIGGDNTKTQDGEDISERSLT